MPDRADAVTIAERPKPTEPALSGETPGESVDRRHTHGVGRGELPPAGQVECRFAWVREGERAAIHAVGDVVRDDASELAALIHHLNPEEHPSLTLDLRRATSLDPLVVHALIHAWERRNRTLSCIRVRVSPGPVAHFLAYLNLTNILDVVQADEEGQIDDSPPSGKAARVQEVMQAIRHYRAMHQAVRDRDLAALQKAAGESGVADDASDRDGPGVTPGRWSEPCALRAQYGGCQPLAAHTLRAAELGNWDAAELLILSMIAEASGIISAGEPHVCEGV